MAKQRGLHLAPLGDLELHNFDLAHVKLHQAQPGGFHGHREKRSRASRDVRRSEGAEVRPVPYLITAALCWLRDWQPVSVPPRLCPQSLQGLSLQPLNVLAKASMMGGMFQACPVCLQVAQIGAGGSSGKLQPAQNCGNPKWKQKQTAPASAPARLVSAASAHWPACGSLTKYPAAAGSTQAASWGELASEVWASTIRASATGCPSQKSTPLAWPGPTPRDGVRHIFTLPPSPAATASTTASLVPPKPSTLPEAVQSCNKPPVSGKPDR